MLEQATFGGGCFWCTEAIFRQVQGVTLVESGYSGGSKANPTYREVCDGNTGHAEVVQVTFDPSQISYADLLRIHLTTHNPMTRNRQGADIGTQYRSIILTHNASQAATAQAVIAELAPNFDNPIVTIVQEFETFYKAENYHQDYFSRNADKPYCEAVISPKLAKFKKLYAERLKV
ncbi:MAG TPA: peptide-methionine (S)-S-oxide reductase MsrA [Anaerolineales bacterium]|nr:peptide-methionine (S)-S-oxide reductase MsrA [Anaerolineales bacterium]